jgi:hypothetical protein
MNVRLRGMLCVSAGGEPVFVCSHLGKRAALPKFRKKKQEPSTFMVGKKVTKSKGNASR